MAFFLATLLPCLLTAGILALSLVMSIRDIRTREVYDRDLALFCLFTLSFRLLTLESFMTAGSPWFLHIRDLLMTASGALLLFFIALVSRLFGRGPLIGSGDILYALAGGFLLTARDSVSFVALAFLLAFPFSLFLFLAGKRKETLPFIPFLFLALLLVRAGLRF